MEKSILNFFVTESFYYDISVYHVISTLSVCEIYYSDTTNFIFNTIATYIWKLNERIINAFERALLFFSRFFTAVSDVFDISEQIENNFMSYMLIDWKSLFTETSSQVANSRILHIAPCRYIYVYSPTGVIYA